jgi:hypothetical protein
LVQLLLGGERLKSNIFYSPSRTLFKYRHSHYHFETEDGYEWLRKKVVFSVVSGKPTQGKSSECQPTIAFIIIPYICTDFLQWRGNYHQQLKNTRAINNLIKALINLAFEIKSGNQLMITCAGKNQREQANSLHSDGNHCLWSVPHPLMLGFNNFVRNVRPKCCT